jgi:hypothetical protein
MPTYLEELQVAEVSLVPKAANQRRFLLWKSDTPKGGDEPMEELLKAALESKLANEEAIDQADLTDQAKDALRGSLRILNAHRQELPKDVLTMMAKVGGWELAKEAAPKPEPTHMSAPVRKADGSWDMSGLETVPQEVRPMVEQLWKAHIAQVEKAEKLEAQLKKAQDEQALREYVAKAQEFSNLPMPPAELGLVLKMIHDGAPDVDPKVMQLLTAVNAQLVENAIYKELGHGGARAGSAYEKLEAAAKGLVEKDATMTFEQAMLRVMELHPELYSEYLTERGSK